MLCQCSQHITSQHLRTIAASIIAFANYTLAYLALLCAIVCLEALSATSHTVDPLGLEFHLIHLAPLFRHLLTQTVLVVDGGQASLAFLAVEAVASY